MPKVIEDLEFRLSEEARRQVERSGCAAYCSSFTAAAWVDTWPTVRSRVPLIKRTRPVRSRTARPFSLVPSAPSGSAAPACMSRR